VLLPTYEEQVVSLGSRVHIRDIESGERDVYTLARPRDADIRQNRISTLTPLGKALYGAQPGHVVKVHAPGGVFLVKIESVDQETYPQFARDG
jgi:transcription elongation GreA/GreB family factor